MFFVVRVNGSRAVAEFGNGTEVRHDSRHCTITDETRPSFLSQLRIVLLRCPLVYTTSVRLTTNQSNGATTNEDRHG